MDPKYAQAHNSLGNALRIKGQLAGAIAECRRAIALDPDDSLAHDFLGIALRNNGQVDAAMAEFRIAIRLNPKNAEAYFNLAASLMEKDEFDAALAIAQEGVAKNPDDAQLQDLSIQLQRRQRGTRPNKPAVRPVPKAKASRVKAILQKFLDRENHYVGTAFDLVVTHGPF